MKLSVYFGDSVTVGPRLASDVLVERLAARGVPCALVRGIEGYGLHRRLHAERFPDVSTDLPLVLVAIDHEIDAVADVAGLVTVEPLAEVETGSAELTVLCTDHRAVVDVLRRGGASGATVLAGVDGVLGRRRRARLFGGGLAMVLSAGPAALLRQARERLGDAVCALEPVALLKHDGEHLEPLPVGDGWQAIRVYTRRSRRAGGGALVERLRRAGAAGATTLLGEWGFSGGERPYGDRLGITSHRPTCTVYIDRAERVAANWPMIDELTADHGIVTSRAVPVYRPIGPRFGSSP